MKRFILMIIALAAANAFALEGRVVGVHDGDTITLLDSENHQHKIRLAEIDAPELNQPWGQKAKKTLSDMVYSKTILVNVDTVDRYGREVGTIFLEGVNINYEQINQGSAWAYSHYAKSLKPEHLQEAAAKSRVGLWSLPKVDQIPPWEWRKEQKRETKRQN